MFSHFPIWKIACCKKHCSRAQAKQRIAILTPQAVLRQHELLERGIGLVQVAPLHDFVNLRIQAYYEVQDAAVDVDRVASQVSRASPSPNSNDAAASALSESSGLPWQWQAGWLAHGHAVREDATCPLLALELLTLKEFQPCATGTSFFQLRHWPAGYSCRSRPASGPPP